MGLLIAACDVVGPDDLGKGELRVSFAQDAVTRNVSEIPDTGFSPQFKFCNYCSS